MFPSEDHGVRKRFISGEGEEESRAETRPAFRAQRLGERAHSQPPQLKATSVCSHFFLIVCFCPCNAATTGGVESEAARTQQLRAYGALSVRCAANNHQKAQMFRCIR